jgi:hypothetical protein
VSKQLSDLWSLTSFSFTSELMARQLSPLQLIGYVAGQGLASNIELDGAQFFRNYPKVDSAELAQLRAACQEHGMRISLIGGYMDRFHSSTQPIDQELVMQRLHQQLSLASQLGAHGLRLQFDGLRESELDQATEWAEKFGVKILLELQGSATPNQPQVAQILQWLFDRDHPMLRVLLDSSLLMRGFPGTYKHRLASLGLSAALIAEVESAWRTMELGEYRGWLVSGVQSGTLPGSLMGQMPTLTARFGHTSASDWSEVAPLLDSLHLKYWDADDSLGALSGVAADALSLYDLEDFPGFIVSEWGGHDWIPLEVATGHEMSVRHKLAVAPKLWQTARVG